MMKLLSVALLAIALCSCRTGPNNPPSGLDMKLFTIQTNFTPQVQIHTVIQTQLVNVPNIVTTTNVVTVNQTNRQTMLIPETQYYYQTNFIPKEVLTTNIVTQTNQVPSYTMTPNQLSKDIASGAGAAASPFGWGGVASTAVMGILALWGHLRSTKSQAVSESLAQIIETGSEILKTTPQGAVVADKWKSWMISHQAQEGVIEEVTKIVQNTVDNGTAKDTAAQLLALAQQVKAT